MSKIHATNPPIGIEATTKSLRDANSALEASIKRSGQVRGLVDTGRVQLRLCRDEILLGVRRLRSDDLSPDAALMADAIVEYFKAQAALEAHETEEG